jgi:hypothetical protein
MLHEAILRFPSAPLFGAQRKRDYQVRIKPVHQHTFRVLTAERPGTSRIERIFLFFNGLNEVEHMGFYYDLAKSLIKPDGVSHSEVACIIHPFPGHLTRYPMVGQYAEKPLQRFITDPSDLFRQYLRFMVEMQWLLSILVPISYYPVTPGLALLAEDSAPLQGRCDLKILSQVIYNSWKAIYDSSSQIVKDSSEDRQLKELREAGEKVSREVVQRSISSIRQLIGWVPYEKPLAACQAKDGLPPPRIHVVGYSLGGYLAQSAFFTWPFAINSCTTLCSGGPLHDLRPLKIVHEEEWRAITHGLKYELECAMLEGRLRIDPAGESSRSVCGIIDSYFSSHFQIFNDVFLQDPNGSYRSRVSEFASRLLFVVGGNDPIVSTKLVLDASPSEGINLIEVAKLSHFVAVEKGEWLSFWLPTVGRVLFSLSEHSEMRLAESMLSNLWNKETTGAASGTWPEDSDSSQSRVKPDNRLPEPLDSNLMQRALFDLVEPLKDGGFLLILRNQIPFTLMGKRMLHRRGSVPHYEDFHIRRFWQQIQARYQTMLDYAGRIALVAPGRLNEWFVRQPSVVTVKNLLLVREPQDSDSLSQIWRDFLSDWETKGALYRFNPEHPVEISEADFPLEHMVRSDTSTPMSDPVLNCLPDLWIGLSKEVVKDFAGSTAGRTGIIRGFCKHVLDIYTQRHRDTDQYQAIDKTRDWLISEDLRVIRISAAQSPRFLGERIWNAKSAEELLIHSALALARSTLCKAAGDFAKDWPTAEP